MSDCLQTNKPSMYSVHSNTKINSAFYPSGVGKSSTGLSEWLRLWRSAFTCDGWHV